jgi:hypothetical protein
MRSHIVEFQQSALSYAWSTLRVIAPSEVPSRPTHQPFGGIFIEFGMEVTFISPNILFNTLLSNVLTLYFLWGRR